MTLGKTCRLCIVCEVLIAHEQEVTPLLKASGVTMEGEVPNYVVLGTVAPDVWRAGLAHAVTLEAIRESMADFKQYLRIDVTPGRWSHDEDIAASRPADARRQRTVHRHQGHTQGDGEE